MTIMYVDESGSPDYKDYSTHFVLSGIIVDDNSIKNLQRGVFEYKQSHFRNEFVDSEIHTHDIYKSRQDFGLLTRAEKTDLLDHLYGMINSLDCRGIIVAIDKQKFSMQNPSWSIATTAWSFILERYSMELEENSSESGKLAVDKSSNKIQRETTKTIDGLMKWGARHRRIMRVSLPTFVDSCVCGIQVADAFAYGATQHLIDNGSFGKYWTIILGKLRSKNNAADGHGYKVYPS
ncbi:MAG: DUF3800 domain-containing protein [Thaumarchaeota archaeon]|nr:DUF3800 domain-containing protein [Nitrososphaerota archaeon]